MNDIDQRSDSRTNGLWDSLPSALTRRRLLGAGAGAGLGWMLPACGGGGGATGSTVIGGAGASLASRTPMASTDPVMAEKVRALARASIETRFARAVLVRVTVDGKEIITEAFGESAAGVPATTDMHFRNGAVAIALVAMLLLRLVDEGKVALDDKVATWLPKLPHGDRVTLRHLAQMTAGYADYVRDPDFVNAFLANPFRRWTPDELLAFAIHKPLLFEPGINWAYAHTNYVILGLALEKLTGRSVKDLMQDKVLGPLGMTQTSDPESASIPEPVLRAFSSERREFLGVAAGTPFYEESTFWDPSWTITHGAVQVTDLYDLHTSAIAFGRGTILSPESHAAQVSTALRGKSTPVEGCVTCLRQWEGYAFGLGVVTSGNWVLQPPMFGGYSAVAGYHEGSRLAIAVAVTYTPEAFNDAGDYKNGNEAENLFVRIATALLPDDLLPIARR